MDKETIETLAREYFRDELCGENCPWEEASEETKAYYIARVEQLLHMDDYW